MKLLNFYCVGLSDVALCTLLQLAYPCIRACRACETQCSDNLESSDTSTLILKELLQPKPTEMHYSMKKHADIMLTLFDDKRRSVARVDDDW